MRACRRYPVCRRARRGLRTTRTALLLAHLGQSVCTLALSLECSPIMPLHASRPFPMFVHIGWRSVLWMPSIYFWPCAELSAPSIQGSSCGIAGHTYDSRLVQVVMTRGHEAFSLRPHQLSKPHHRDMRLLDICNRHDLSTGKGAPRHGYKCHLGVLMYERPSSNTSAVRIAHYRSLACVRVKGGAVGRVHKSVEVVFTLEL